MGCILQYMLSFSLIRFPHAGGGIGRFRDGSDHGLPLIDNYLPSLSEQESRIMEESYPWINAADEDFFLNLSHILKRAVRFALARISFVTFFSVPNRTNVPRKEVG